MLNPTRTLVLTLAICALTAVACDDGDPVDVPTDTASSADTTATDTSPAPDTDDPTDTVEPGDTLDATDTREPGDTTDATDVALDTDALDTDEPDTSDAELDTADMTPPMPPEVAWRGLDDVSGVPAARWGRQVAWITDSSALVFGGVDGSDAVQADLWRVDIASDGTVSATEVTTTDAPSPRYCGCMAYDPASETLLVVGGRSFSAFFAETWALDLATGQWTQITESPGPTRVLGCAMEHSAHTGDLYLFGGASMAGVTDETWRFDPDTSTWTQLEISGPAARYDAGMRSIDGGRSLLMFAGAASGQAGFMADVWRFDTELELWDPIDTSASTATPPGRRTPWMVTTPDDAFLIGGLGVAGLQPGSALGDLWILDLAQGEWTELGFNGEVPAARGFAPALPGGASGLGLLLGGFDMSVSTGDGWLLETL